MIFDVNDPAYQDLGPAAGATEGLNGLQIAAVATAGAAACPALALALFAVPEITITGGLAAGALGYAGHRKANGLDWNPFAKDDDKKSD